ncbi:AHH domain-containing protein [Archangium lansingense]|uniref:AHH domain-containing protein n=1 Tax=Archangium lansingense TaxID=2995310 RepID=A0ABT4AGW8_9BACT|nr:AHH domain-containing protein [Archangium lansinium]MCY1080890.1 AHH domain-containing protein [Archangium lansinium]
MHEQFIARYGTPFVPLPDCLKESALFMALRLSPRYMPVGMREAAQALFKDPAFLAGVATALVVYLIAWAAPEPIFTKSFAMAATVLLASVFTIAEIAHAGAAAWALYQDTQGLRTLAQIEAAAERFGRTMGGVGFRILVAVASWGVAKGLPRVPPGGAWAWLKQRRLAFVGGMELSEVVSVQATSVQAMADGSLLVAGVSAGNTAQVFRSACKDGLLKVTGFTWHHLATNKNEISDLRGGPWTPLFEAIFAQAGMTLDAGENQVFLKDHGGPHPEAYHEEVHRRLREAIKGCKTKQLCRAKLVDELKRISDEVCTPGTRLHRLSTKS